MLRTRNAEILAKPRTTKDCGKVHAGNFHEMRTTQETLNILA